MTSTIKIDTTKKGFAAMWESGGGMTSGGSATIITGPNGEARRAIYIPRGGHLACKQHALIGVGNDFHIVTASVRHGSRDSAMIKRIVGTAVKDVHGERYEATAEVEVVNTFTRGEWDHPLDPKFEAAVDAAFRKASSYHCRSVYYVDTSPRPDRSEADKERMQSEMKRQDEERAKLRQAKADADAKAKAEREAASKAAKDSGLGARLDTTNDRIAALEPDEISSLAVHNKDGFSFTHGQQTLLYTEENIAWIERHVDQMEREAAEAKRRLQAKNAFQSKFEALRTRAEALDLTIEFGDDGVELDRRWDIYAYSNEGLADFEAMLVKEEREATEAKRKADAEACYNALKAQGRADGLPQNIEIWKRTSGATNAGNGWVIGTNGMDREPTFMHNPRPRYRSEGNMVWEQILPGEVVLRWAKAYTAAEHEFEVVYMPTEGLTPAQLERIAEIEAELAQQWDGRQGMSSNTSSPPVGNGWGLVSKPKSQAPANNWSINDLKARFNGR